MTHYAALVCSLIPDDVIYVNLRLLIVLAPVANVFSNISELTIRRMSLVRHLTLDMTTAKAATRTANYGEIISFMYQSNPMLFSASHAIRSRLD